MKTLHFAIITGCVIGIFVTIGILVTIDVFSFFDQSQQETQTYVNIQNIQVEPATIKVGDTFTVSATLVNNSQNPITVYVDTCASSVFVIFDSHVTVDMKEILCLQQLMLRKVNPDEKFIQVDPKPSTTFRSTEAGITNATVTFHYEEKNPVDPNSHIRKTISKSFLFTISN